MNSQSATLRNSPKKLSNSSTLNSTRPTQNSSTRRRALNSLRGLRREVCPPEKIISPQSRKDAKQSAVHAGLNITEMCLDRWQTDEMKDQPAVIWEGEDGRNKNFNVREPAKWLGWHFCAAGLTSKQVSSKRRCNWNPPTYDVLKQLFPCLPSRGWVLSQFRSFRVTASLAIEATTERCKCKSIVYVQMDFRRRGKWVNRRLMLQQVARQAIVEFRSQSH